MSLSAYGTKFKSRRGFALVTIITATSFFIVLSIAIAGWALYEYRLSNKSYNVAAALSLAEAGAERALWEINYSASPWAAWGSTIDGLGNTVKTIDLNSFSAYGGEVIGDISVSASISPSGNPVFITSQGFTPNRTSPKGRKTVKVTASNAIFTNAVFGLSEVSLSGHAETDSYDSRLGTYGSQPHGQEGDVGSNGNITISGQAEINGDATPGPGSTVNNPSRVSGSTSPASSITTFDPIPATYLIGTQDLVLSGTDVLTLTTGSYFYHSIKMSGQSQIVISGVVSIYVNGGSIILAGMGIVNNAAPANLSIYSSGTDINMAGQANFVGTVYAPNANINLSGTGDIYGAIIGNNIQDTGQGRIHYDIALNDKSIPFAKFKVRYWQEL